MHSLETIQRLNSQAVERLRIEDQRSEGKWIVARFEGLAFVEAYAFDTQEEATFGRTFGRQTDGSACILLSPRKPGIAVTRDQSEDRGVNYPSLEDYLEANPSAKR